MTSIYQVLKMTMETPTIFSRYHLAWLALALTALTLLCFYIPVVSTRSINRLSLTFGILFVILEAYKQFILATEIRDDVLVWHYDFANFPFQFCSLPLYFFLLIPLTKGNLRQGLLTFMASYGGFAGALVLAYPTSVYSDVIGLNAQTMLWHGSMFVFSGFLIIKQVIKLNRRDFLISFQIMVFAFSFAIILNDTIGAFLVSQGSSFNMFFISRYGTPPIFANLFNTIPYWLFLIGYLCGFTILAILPFQFFKFLYWLNIIIDNWRLKLRNRTN